MDFPDITAEVIRTRQTSEGTEVVVSVVGPKKTPDLTRGLRARTRAIAVAGVMPTTVTSVKQLTAGEVGRLTDEKGDPEREPEGRLFEKTTHTIIVDV